MVSTYSAWELWPAENFWRLKIWVELRYGCVLSTRQCAAGGDLVAILPDNCHPFIRYTVTVRSSLLFDAICYKRYSQAITQFQEFIAYSSKGSWSVQIFSLARWVGLDSVLRGDDDPHIRGISGGKHVPDKPNTANNCNFGYEEPISIKFTYFNIYRKVGRIQCLTLIIKGHNLY